MKSKLLSRREEEVLMALIEDPDRGDAEIGELIGLSPSTIKVYMSRLRIKTGATSKAGLVGWYYTNRDALG